MGRNINTGTLTKQHILNKVSQVTIFSTYLNLSDAIVQHCIDTQELILSPIREDINPTCGFRYDNKDKLKFKDFAGYFWGDCFDLVAYVMSNMYNKEINISNKEDFIKVLRHITFMFKDIFYGQSKDINLITEVNATIVNLHNTKPNIELVVRDWNNLDKQQWACDITLQDLNIEFIYPVDQYYINRNINPKPKYFYNDKDPCYGYLLGKDRSGINNIKLYFPKRDKGSTRFITNCNHLEGIYTLDRNDYNIIVITKSTKDRVAIKTTIKKMSFLYGELNTIKIGVINIPHETYRLRQNEYDWINSKLIDGGVVISLMDNDRTGKLQAIWLRDNFIITPFIIPVSYKVKDFYEWRNKLGIKHVATNIIDIIINIKEYETTTIRKYYKLTGYSEESNVSPF